MATLLEKMKELRVDPQEKGLIAAFFFTAIGVIALGGALGFILALIRTPFFQMQAPGLYYRALTAHAILNVVYWFIFIQCGLLVIACTVLLKGQRLASRALGWVGFAFLAGGLAADLIGILAGADVLYTAFPPLSFTYTATPLIYLGYVLASVGSFLTCINCAATFYIAVERKGSFASWKKLLGEMPISSFAAMVGIIMAVPLAVIAFWVFGSAFLASMGLLSQGAMSYRMNYHIVFHIMHYIPAMTLVGVAYMLVELATGAESIYSKKVAKGLFLLYPAVVPPTFLYHLLVDPSISGSVKALGSSLSLMVGTPTILHMFIILGMVEARMRSAGYGPIGWLRRLPWGNPAFGSMIMGMFSMMVAGVLSYLLLQPEFAKLLHSTFAVPAYIHPMVLGGATLIYMGATYYIVTGVRGRQLWGAGIAKVQPYILTAALIVFALLGTMAGYAGVPRRIASISFGADTPARWSALMNVGVGVGGIAATLALALFILVVAMTAFAGKKVTAFEQMFRGLTAAPLPLQHDYRRSPVSLLPGTIFLAVVLVLTVFTMGIVRGWPIQF